MIIGFGVVAGMTIFAYAFYIIFFPLLKTISPFKIIQGNLPMLKERDEQRVKTLINKDTALCSMSAEGFVAIPLRKRCQSMKDSPDCF